MPGRAVGCSCMLSVWPQGGEGSTWFLSSHSSMGLSCQEVSSPPLGFRLNPEIFNRWLQGGDCGLYSSLLILFYQLVLPVCISKFCVASLVKPLENSDNSYQSSACLSVGINVSSPCFHKHEIVQLKQVRRRDGQDHVVSSHALQAGLGSPWEATAGLWGQVRRNHPASKTAKVFAWRPQQREGQCVMVSSRRWVEIKEEGRCLIAPEMYFGEVNFSACLWAGPSPGTLLCGKPSPKMSSNPSSLALFCQLHCLWRDICS